MSYWIIHDAILCDISIITLKIILCEAGFRAKAHAGLPYHFSCLTETFEYTMAEQNTDCINWFNL